MRFKITLGIDKKKYGNALPMNHQYELSAVLYKIISQANEAYSTWLHNNGFTVDHKQFKLFTYSRLTLPSYRIDKSRGLFLINSETIEWYVSFLPEESTEKFVQGIFMNQSFQLGNNKHKIECHVQTIEAVGSPQFENEMTFETLSPICIALRNDKGKTDYLSPEAPRSKESILFSLLNKYKAFHGKTYTGDAPFDFQVLTPPRSTLITFKAGTPDESRVRGYMCQFKMKTSAELMKIMYESGIGMKCSQGWGMVKKL